MTEATELAIKAFLRRAAPREVPADLIDRARMIPSTIPTNAHSRRPAWLARRGAAIPAALSAFALGAIAVLSLAATPRAPGASGGTPLPSKQSTDATNRPGPLIECRDIAHSYKGAFIPFLTCDAAVDATLAALPNGHPDIARLEFGFGAYCRPASPCPTSLELLDGYVVVIYATEERVLVSLRDESTQSGVHVTGIEPLP